MKEICNRTIVSTAVDVPGSKSMSHRMLIAAALSDGPCTIENLLESEDTGRTLAALGAMGIDYDISAARCVIHGCSGRLAACDRPVDLGNSGTSMRLLTAIAALGQGTYRLTGTARMQQRPIQDLIDALSDLGVVARSVNGNGCPPVEVTGGRINGRAVTVSGAISSQFLSALLLMAPYTANGLDIRTTKDAVSRPYIDLTLDVMARFGVRVTRTGYRRFQVPGGCTYRWGTYTVAPDCSQAGYFWAAAAVTGARIRVNGIAPDAGQGDARFPQVLGQMGCRVDVAPEGIAVTGGPLQGISVDMGDMPDLVPTLAVVAAFAEGTTEIRNVGHLKVKESDRLAAVVTELTKMGIAARHTGDRLTVVGGAPTGAVIETYDDHRMAMSFAVAGLRVPGVCILEESCVAKSFPKFWEVFDALGRPAA